MKRVRVGRVRVRVRMVSRVGRVIVRVRRLRLGRVRVRAGRIMAIFLANVLSNAPAARGRMVRGAAG